MTGYASREYALSFGEIAEPLALAGSGGYLLVRPIPGSRWRDTAGCYPIFSCRLWGALADDMRHLPPDLVSATLVADPFCALTEGELRAIFGIVRPLGEHYVTDLTSAAARSPSRHHQRKLRHATRNIEIAVAERPLELLEDWMGLYQTLSEKHKISSHRQFSRSIFAKQLVVPGSVVLTARLHRRLLGADWYFVDGERVFAHLSAYSVEGYEHSVSYPMLAAAIEYFSAWASLLDLGGVPRTSAMASTGLRGFKAGWASFTLPSYLCGIDLMEDEYTRLSGGRSSSETTEFFPYYRRTEYLQI